MPVLKLKDNPPALTKYGRSVNQLPKYTGLTRPKRGINRWYVAQTKSQQERRLACELRSLKVSYFLPMKQDRVKRGSTRYVDGMKLTFPGYLFFWGDPADWSTVRETGRIFQIIDVRDQVLLENELDKIHAANCDNYLKHSPYKAFVAGKKVRFIRGAMKGEEAIIEGMKLKSDGEVRIQLSVSLLGYASYSTDVTNLELAAD